MKYVIYIIWQIIYFAQEGKNEREELKEGDIMTIEEWITLSIFMAIAQVLALYAMAKLDNLFATLTCLALIIPLSISLGTWLSIISEKLVHPSIPIPAEMQEATVTNEANGPKHLKDKEEEDPVILMVEPGWFHANRSLEDLTLSVCKTFRDRGQITYRCDYLLQDMIDATCVCNGYEEGCDSINHARTPTFKLCTWRWAYQF